MDCNGKYFSFYSDFINNVLRYISFDTLGNKNRYKISKKENIFSIIDNILHIFNEHAVQMIAV